MVVWIHCYRHRDGVCVEASAISSLPQTLQLLAVGAVDGVRDTAASTVSLTARVPLAGARRVGTGRSAVSAVVFVLGR